MAVQAARVWGRLKMAWIIPIPWRLFSESQLFRKSWSLASLASLVTGVRLCLLIGHTRGPVEAMMEEIVDEALNNNQSLLARVIVDC
jgi:hypothetical protein